LFLLDKYQTKANIERIKLDKTATSRRAIKDCIKALTIVFKPKIIKHLYIYIQNERQRYYQVQLQQFLMLVVHEMFVILQLSPD